MLVWNPLAPSSWAALFGFVAVPLFGKQRQPNGPDQHFVLLDGRRSSLTFSQGSAVSLLQSGKPIEWAWSSNIPRSIVVDDKSTKIYALRWDDPDNIRELSNVSPQSAQSLLAEMEIPSGGRGASSVVRALQIFRSVRKEVREYGGSDYDSARAFTVLLLLADLLRREGRAEPQFRMLGDVVNDLASRTTKLVTTEPFSADVASLPIADLAVQLLLNGENRLLDPYLLIRHASATLFQEAHIELATPPTRDPKLFVSLRNELPKPVGTLRRDAHYTPSSLARFLTEQAIKEFLRLNAGATKITILDPASGSGIFLAESLRELEGSGISVIVRGIDSSPISKLMTEFTTSSAEDDFIAAGGIAEHAIQDGDALALSWNQPDIILMNPPFKPWRSLDQKMRRQVKETLGDLYHGHADTALAFLAKAVREMKPGSVLASVVPAAVLHSSAAEKIRSLLSGPEFQPVVIGRVRDYGYFTNATVEPGFVIISRSPSNQIPVRTVLAETEFADQALRASRTTPIGAMAIGDGWEIGARNSLDFSDWTPRPLGAKSLIEKFSKTVAHVTDLFDTFLGIRTGHNDVFIVPLTFIAELGTVERKLFRPIANTIWRGRVRQSDFVFYPYKDGRLLITDVQELQRVAPVFYSTRLKPMMSELKQRDSLRGREWWELVEPRTTWLTFGTPRILSTSFGRRGAFALDINGEYAVVQGQAWFWKGKEELTLDAWLGYLALLNSPSFEAMLDYFCPRTQGGQYELARRYLQYVPLPDLSLGHTHRIEKLAGYGRAMAERRRVPLHSLNEAVATAFGVAAHEFATSFPLTRLSRLEEEFEKLSSTWKRETGMLSSSAQRMQHPSLQRILQMGQMAIPFIIRDLAEKPAWWFSVLRELTEVDPVPGDKKGLLRESADAWIAWAHENGYEL